MINTFIDQLISNSSSHGTMRSLFISRLLFFPTIWRVRHALLWEPLLQVTFILWILGGFQQVLGLVYLLERDSNSFCDLFEVIEQTAAGFLKTLKRFLIIHLSHDPEQIPLALMGIKHSSRCLLLRRKMADTESTEVSDEN